MRVALLVISIGLLHCERAPQPSAWTEPSSAPSAAPQAARLTVVDEQQSWGLVVRSGTISPPHSVPATPPGPWGFSELELDGARVRLQVVSAPGGAPLSKLLPEGGLAVVNGGYFEANFEPSTWLVSGGVELAKKTDTSKGGVLAMRPGRVYVGPMAGLNFQPELALQSFPLIVESDFKPGIRRDDGRRAGRTVACVVGSRLHLIVVSAPRGEGPTLFEAADMLRAARPSGFGCRVALNLDGGPSSGAWFSPAVGARQRPPLANVGYALAILPH